MILCDGSTNTSAATRLYMNMFTVVPPAGNTPGRLWCPVNGTSGATRGPVALVEGVQNMVIYYGVKRNARDRSTTTSTPTSGRTR